jgi:hypothetical protein
MRPGQRRALDRLEALRQARKADPIKVRLTTGASRDYAHQGHRVDTPDERNVRHVGKMSGWRDPKVAGAERWIAGRRHVWRVDSGMWVPTGDLHREAKPKAKPAPRVVTAVRGSEDATLRRAVDAVVAEGGRPEEVMVIVKEKRR